MTSKIDKLDECRDALKMIKGELDQIEQFPADISVSSVTIEAKLVRDVHRFLEAAYLMLAERLKDEN